jgi:ParB family transcriptional regulator, chromosome partitioning protein
VSIKRSGLPLVVKMRHDAHYVEEISARSGAAIGRMIAIDLLQPNAEQPRKDRGDLHSLTESVREKGVLEPLLVRPLREAGRYLIISGERRYFAARAAGLAEVPCIEKDVGDEETLEIALIENLQRKDLTPFEEADGIQNLADRFGLTHEQIGKQLGKARSSVTEVLTLRSIPDNVKAFCIESGVLSKSQLLQVARQETEGRMRDVARRFAAGLLNRDEARAERHDGKTPKPVFRFVAPQREFSLTLKFRGNQQAERGQVIAALRRIIESLEAGQA